MLKQESKTFDGVEVTVQQLPAMAGLRMFRRLGAALGPAVAKGAGAFSDGLGDIDVDKLAAGLAQLFETLTDDDLEFITNGLLEGALVKQGSKGRVPLLPVLDITLSVPVLIQVLTFAIKVNYGDFRNALRGFAGPAARIATATQEASTSLNT